MRALIKILTEYEGAIQEDNDEHSDENIARLEKARENLMVVLQEAKQLEKYQQALQWALTRVDIAGLKREGFGRIPRKYNEVHLLAYGESDGDNKTTGDGGDNGTVVSSGSR
jgi:hypothetical protein